MKATDPAMWSNCKREIIQIIIATKPAHRQPVFPSGQAIQRSRKPGDTISCNGGNSVIKRMPGKLMQLRRAKKNKFTVP